MDPVQAVLIYLPLTGAICLGIRVLWRADKLITAVRAVMKTHPPHSHSPDNVAVISYDPDWPPPITTGLRTHQR